MNLLDLYEMRDPRDAYERDVANSTSGFGKDSQAYRADGGANDEQHELDPSEWYIVKDDKMFKVTVYPNQEQQAISRGYSRTRDEAKAKATQQGVTESDDYSAVTGAITRRIITQHPEVLAKYGPAIVSQAIDEIADFVGDVDEIGSSDVSGWVSQVIRSLGRFAPVTDESRTEVKDKQGKVVSWKDDTEWHPAEKNKQGQPKDPRGVVTHMSDVARRKTADQQDMAEAEVDSDGYSMDHADSGEYDYEGDQARDQMNTIVRAARRLDGLLDDNENMPEWVQMKVTLAADYLDTAADYIESNQEPELAEDNHDDLDNHPDNPKNWGGDHNDQAMWNEKHGVAEGERGRGRPPSGEQDTTPVTPGRVEKIATGIRHHADASRYGGTEPDAEDDYLMSKSHISRLGKMTEPDIDEGWKEKLGGAALAGAMALGAGGAQARVTPGDDPGINRLTGKPIATQQATDTAPTQSTSSISVAKSQAQYDVDTQTLTYKGKQYKWNSDAQATGQGEVVTAPSMAVGSRSMGSTKVELNPNGTYTRAPANESQEKVGNMDADEFDAAMARLKQLAGAGPLKTVYDPTKRVYRNVPVAVQPKK